MTRAPGGSGRFRLVTFDIDGTLTAVHGWRVLAEEVGRTPEYEESNRQFLAGEIGEDAHLADLLGLAEGLTLARVAAILERTPKVGGIPEAIGLWHGDGIRVALLSHNPEYVCAWYAHRFGFDGYAGSPTPPLVHGRIPPPGRVRADKLAGLGELTARWGIPPRSVVHVGDGRADAALFRRVGGGVALNSSLGEVEAAADLVLRMNDIRELPRLIGGMRPRPRPSADHGDFL